MSVMRKVMKRIHKQKGAALVEYGLLVALIAVGAIAAISSVGDSVDTTFDDVATCLTDSSTAGNCGNAAATP